jgi:hypothetical protein
MKYSRKSKPPVSQLLKELESGKHKSKGIQKPNAGAMSALKAVASKNTHKPHKHSKTVTRKAREYAGLGPSDREALSSFEQGGKVKGNGKKDPITKESVFKMTQERLNKEFPNNTIAEKEVRDISMVWLLTGLDPKVMDKQVKKIRDRNRPGVAPRFSHRSTGAEADEELSLIVNDK